MGNPSSTLEADLGIIATSTTYSLEAAVQRAIEAVDWPEDVPLPEDLTPDQRRLAEVLATRCGIPALASVAIPYEVQFRRRWLGVEPAGELEKRYPFQRKGKDLSWPLWRIWQTVGDNPKRKKGISAVVTDQGALLDAYVDACLWGPYPKLDVANVFDLVANTDTSAGAWAARRLSEMVSWPVGPTKASGSAQYTKTPEERYGFSLFEYPALTGKEHVFVALFVALARSSTPVDPAWERFFPITYHPLIIEAARALGDDRRERVLAERLDQVLTVDAVLTVFQLWKKYPYPALHAWTSDLLARTSQQSGIEPPELARLRGDWSKLEASAPASARTEKPAKVTRKKPAATGGKPRASTKPKAKKSPK